MESNEHVDFNQLQNALEIETTNYESLKRVVDFHNKNKVKKEITMLNQRRETEYYLEKLKQMPDVNQEHLENAIKEVLNKRERLKQLEASLNEFKDIEPTDESLKRKIDDLKKSRLSLDMTFVDDSLKSVE